MLRQWVILINIIFLILILNSCKAQLRKNETHSFKLDTSLITIAKTKIFSPKYANFRCCFSTRLYAEFYSNDSLKEKRDTLQNDISSFYTWDKDTFYLVADIGELVTSALYIKMYKNNMSILFLKCAHIHPWYKLQPDGKAEICIEVPCKEYDCIISEVPDSTHKQTIYGYIKLKSDDYYYDHPIQGFKKLRTNMAFYFRANYEKREVSMQ